MKRAIKALKIFIVLALVFVGAYVFVNWGTLGKLVFNDASASPAEQKKTQIATKVKDFGEATHSTNKSQSVSILKNLQNDAASQFKNDWFYYPNLAIEAPLEWQVAQGDIEKMMPQSLINVKGSALPAQNGDMLIAGHSSYYSWSKGTYKNIFATLVKAKVGDNIIVRRKDLTNFYQVADVFQIDANANLPLNVGGTYKKNVYLMTCVPVGTSWKRLIIRADFVRAI